MSGKDCLACRWAVWLHLDYDSAGVNVLLYSSSGQLPRVQK